MGGGCEIRGDGGEGKREGKGSYEVEEGRYG